MFGRKKQGREVKRVAQTVPKSPCDSSLLSLSRYAAQTSAERQLYSALRESVPMIDAALEGIQNHLSPKAGEDRNLYLTDLDAVSSLKKLPDSLEKARHLAAESAFIREHIPAELLEAYLKH